YLAGDSVDPTLTGWRFADFNQVNGFDDADRAAFNAHYGTVLPAPPSAPNTLTATAALGEGRIDLNWAMPVDTDVDGSHVYRSLTAVRPGPSGTSSRIRPRRIGTRTTFPKARSTPTACAPS